MTVREIKQQLGLFLCWGDEKLEHKVTGGYVGDLLSDVMANSKAGNVWITMQTHVNIVAVAVLKELAAIIIVNGRHPAEETLKKAAEEKVPILSSTLSAFDVAGRLYFLGVGKARADAERIPD
ncbi:MAG: serine kinase [Ignavibacteriae bacterium]|nr:serine kinase [Ignavibacteriota bacterium]